MTIPLVAKSLDNWVGQKHNNPVACMEYNYDNRFGFIN